MSVAGLARQGRATELAGIGQTLQEKIVALFDTGTIPAMEKLRAKVPAGLIAITRLPGLGPKRARLLALTARASTRSRRCARRRSPGACAA